MSRTPQEPYTALRAIRAALSQSAHFPADVDLARRIAEGALEHAPAKAYLDAGGIAASVLSSGGTMRNLVQSLGFRLGQFDPDFDAQAFYTACGYPGQGKPSPHDRPPTREERASLDKLLTAIAKREAPPETEEANRGALKLLIVSSAAAAAFLLFELAITVFGK